ncbi:hypothetical protein EIP91_010216 [Steccherinum ochraceum]|uniref:Assembly factor cbp4 n=1 Tax=Steccherinum ochraceum TaxID=92696 RepID=A0A4R0R0V6_9APHY|nr:hypothetical protein EIP91_010216 [Steccherinum ochraceum]
MASFPWGRVFLAGTALVGTGYIIMRATVPTPEQTYAAMSPDLRRKVDANRAARLAREEATRNQMNAQQEDPDASKPVWADGRRT